MPGDVFVLYLIASFFIGIVYGLTVKSLPLAMVLSFVTTFLLGMGLSAVS